MHSGRFKQQSAAITTPKVLINDPANVKRCIMSQMLQQISMHLYKKE